MFTQIINYIKTNSRQLALLFIVSVPLILPYFREGYFPTHDGEWAVVRLADMYRVVVQDYQLPARVSGYLNAGYGYPLFNFAYPFPYYIGLIPLAFGFGFVASIKLLFAISVPLSAWLMYMASSRLWKSNSAGVVSAIFYIYAPYRMVDLYVRGSIGEALSFVLFPALLYIILKIVDEKASVWSTAMLAMLFFLLIGTHNIMTVLFAPVLFVFAVTVAWLKNKKALKSIGAGLFFGILLSSFFWMPALIEKELIWLSETPIADRSLYFVNIQQLVFSSWGYAPPTEPGGFSYQIGLGQIGILLLSIGISVYMFMKKYKKSYKHKAAAVLTGVVLVSLIMMFKPTAYIWESLPLLKEINYPWTYLSQIVLIISLLAGFIVTRSSRLMVAVVLLMVVSIITVLPNASPERHVNRGDDFYVTNDAVTTSSDELLPLWVKEKPLSRAEEKVVTGEKDSVDNLFYNSRYISFNIDLEQERKVTVQTTYYPGWKFRVDDEPAEISHENKYGAIELDVSSGSHYVEGRFVETPLRAMANSISTVSLLVILSTLAILPIRRFVENNLLAK